MADAASLTDDQIGCGKCRVDAVQAFFKAAIVMQEAAAPGFDELPVGIDGASAAPDTKNAFAVKL